MFDDIIMKPVYKQIYLFLGEINPGDFAKGFEIWCQKTVKKEVIVCQDKTEQDQTVMGQQQVED